MQTLKQSDLGPIPEDWNETTIGALDPFVTSGSRGWARYYSNMGDLFVRITNMSRESIFLDLTDPQFVRLPLTGHEGGRTCVRRGDVLISVTADIGITSFVDARIALPAYINQHIALVRIDADSACSQYIAYSLAASRSQRRFRAITDQGAKAGINLSTVKALRVVLPPVEEQEAITAALSDADALIESLEQLLAKKRQVKQGAMQELLTGKRRLPGFKEEWKHTTLGSIAKIKTGSRNNQDKVEDGDYPFFVRSALVERIDSYSHDCEAILVPGEGGIGSIFHYIHGRFEVHQRVYAITQFSPACSGQFVYFYMVQYFGAHATQNSVKATVDSLRLPTFLNFAMTVPSSAEEQHAITAILSDMDAEIDALEGRLTKARLIKQGMMQELLTGRIRLV